MRITYIFRAPSKERSIERVFEPIMQHMLVQGNFVMSSFVKRWKLWPFSMLYDMLRYAIYSYSRRGELFHITGDIQYVACWMNPDNTIMTIHDCVLLHNKNTPGWFKKMVFKFWYEKPLMRLKKITCISEATRQDLVSFFPWVAEKLVAIPNPIGLEFKFSHKEYYSECPRILHVGTRSNKNLERVIKALDSVNCKLVIIGKLTEDQILLLKNHNINFENHFHITDEEVLAVYKNADIISFPSLFEGFGIPIIEGQTIGRPVLTSDREPMRSVAGEGALFVNPESVDSIREGFLRLMSDKNCYDSVNIAGHTNAERYNIHAVVASYMEVYNKIISDENTITK